ncbi:alpha/beta hydrolase family protein [Pararhodobacter zhoushanensis]|uniref:Dienelactone hydrolase n=1 Tax=Pararhodobacter zhoushanensis TaxID=2479545 RepID=A0ABT3H4V1_9RHOB|nr:hypothetical protein [Pararhodobacter zhoushanensis]MCW1934841.1 hypothetical protein [Pararhodobacter zhoushanensis]
MNFALLLSLFALSASAACADQATGVTTVVDRHADRPLTMTLWYPGTGGMAEDVGGNAVFTGVTGARDAAVAMESLPVVLVSHGGLRSAADSGAWLSAGLARAGYLAVEINAPRAPSAVQGVNEIWQRPADMTRALDALTRDPEWSARIDPARIATVGFALGGTAALALAGGRVDPEAYRQSCTPPQSGPDCGWFAAQGVALASVDGPALASPRRDPRIGSVVALAPELVGVFADALSTVAVPSLILSLGDAQSGTGAVPQVTLAATVFDGFATCTPAGPAILREEGGDPALCGGSPSARDAAHAAILAAVLRFLQAAGQ